MIERIDQLRNWLQISIGSDNFSLVPASEDASFRRYFRAQVSDQTFIVMDAPPEKENCIPYIEITNKLLACEVNVPVIYDQDIEQGFLLLTDLGTDLYLDLLNEENAEVLYADALSALARIQKRGEVSGLPPYDEKLLMQEMNLFRDWLLDKHLGLNSKQMNKDNLASIFRLLSNSALEQPRVFVHRDYHSRNLMVCKNNNPGIVDFQDAVCGPYTYDLVSLLKDCYIKWPTALINQWAIQFHLDNGPRDISNSQFQRWFDLIGVQRHLKASGIFARLCHRDSKAGFIKDIPRTLSYIVDLLGLYPELDFLIELIETNVIPALKDKEKSCAP